MLGAMRSDLFDQANLRVQSLKRFTLQNDQMLRLGLGPDVLATKGAMVAYTGQVQFHHEKSGSMAGQEDRHQRERLLDARERPGEAWLAHEAGYLHQVHLENEGLSINARNLLAFDASLRWDINRLKGAPACSAAASSTRPSGAPAPRW